MVAEFESDLIRLRTREGMKLAKPKGRLRGKRPKLQSTNQAKHLLELHDSGNYTQAELGELLASTIHNLPHNRRMRPKPIEPERPLTHILAAVAEHPNPRSAEIAANRVTRLCFVD